MSTKSTIFYYDDDFHFYREAFDTENVYLLLRDRNSVEITEEGVTLKIPVGIMEMIKQSDSPRLDLVGKTDEELLRVVEEEVDSRIAAYKADPHDYWSLVIGALTFGTADQPREEQIKNGMDSYKDDREKQTKIYNSIVKYRSQNPATDR